MHRFSLFLHVLLWSSIGLVAQDVDVNLYRTVDGSFNNLANPQWGSAGENLLRFVPAAYADGMSAPSGADRPNPRVVSNSLFEQSGLLNDPLQLSDFCWVFGQFIDHDIGFTPDGSEFLPIPVPAGDPWFDPANSGQSIIPMMRNAFDPASGNAPSNPRAHPNVVTAFIDGSAVYGSNDEMATWLRTFVDGKLKTSAGGRMLPFNTLTGEYDAPIDPNAPHVDNPVGLSDKLYVAGDVRVNENPLLAAFHALFHLEHNYQCDRLKEKHPDWTDEQLYQHARKIVGGLIQSIVYDEWLPAMGVPMEAYTGYDPTIQPQLMEVFTAAAFRLGHTLLNGNLQRMDNEGEIIPEGNLALRDAFFNPMVIPQVGGIDVYLKGMAAQNQQRFDARVIDDVRNFLFGPPGSGGLDLAAININRGRERGLPGFNAVRQAFGLAPYLAFVQLNSNPEVSAKLASLYNAPDYADPWVGLLAERAASGGLLGPTLNTILNRQFTILRDGDRFYYENDPVLSEEEKAMIRKTTFHDIIMRNTGIKLMQDNVFLMEPHDEICANMTSDVIGWVQLEDGRPVQQVDAYLQVAGNQLDTFTNDAGNFVFEGMPACSVDTLNLDKNDDPLNGVSTLDMLMIARHILGVEYLNSPYKVIAGDVNFSGTVSTMDLISMRRVILSIDTAFTSGKSWRFIPSDFDFTNDLNPFADDFPTAMNFDILSQDQDLNFTAVKLGDVNGSVDLPGSQPNGLETRAEPIVLQGTDRAFEAGDRFTLYLHSDQLEMLRALQFTLEADPAFLRLDGLKEQGLLRAEDVGLFPGEGALTAAWISPEGSPEDRDAVCALEWTALRSGHLMDVLSLSDRRTRTEAVDEDGQRRPVLLHFREANSLAGPDPEGLMLYQNQPNPFARQTTIPFFLSRAARVSVQITDAAGNTVWTRIADFPAGMHNLSVGEKELPAAGVYFYRLKAGEQMHTRRMVLARP